MAKAKNGQSSSGNLPSENQILEFVRNSDGKVGKREISRAFGIKGPGRIALKRLLREMAERGLLESRSRKLSDPTALAPVSVLVVQGQDSDGELYAVPQNWDESSAGQPPKVLIQVRKAAGKRTDLQPPARGEHILGRITATGDTDYPYSAKIIRKLTGPRTRVLGVYRKLDSGEGRITPIDKKARSELQVLPGDDRGAEPGDLVSIDIVRDRGRGLIRARVRERLGKTGDQQNISMLAIHQHGIPDEFPPDVTNAANALPPFSTDNRLDLRDMPLITIDPADARDHDDAIWAEHDTSPDNEGGFKLCVAIADVAAYVELDTALDREARLRGNSVYFPGRVVPMLPEKISNDLCSLREGEDRPALACMMTLNADGKKTGHRFERIVMKSAAKLAYEQAQAAIDGRPGHGVSETLTENVLKPAWQAFAALMKERARRKPLDLDLPERKIALDDAGNVEAITTPPRLDAHRVVEEFMILANVAAAETLEKRKQPLIYRIHDAPGDEKLEALAEVLSSLNLPVPRGQALKPAQFNQILAKARGTPNEHLISQIVLRTQSQAIYSADNLGHFGLNLRRYAHFTSPIRRYADLTVHRALIGSLKLRKDSGTDNSIAELASIAEHISATERRAMAAERDTTDRLLASYLASQVRSRFNGRISGVAKAGLFVVLEDTGADGFVPAASIGDEYYVYDEKLQALVGRQSGQTYQIGDPVEVRLLEVTPIAGGLRLEVLSNGKKGKPASHSRRQSSRRKPKSRRR